MEKAKVTPHPNTIINDKDDLYKYFDNGIEKDKYVLYSNKGTPFEKFLGSWDSEFEALKSGRKYSNLTVIHADVKYIYHGSLKVLCEVHEIK